MFGYIRPLRGELKVREFEGFRSVYCGLCRSLKQSCGVSARFLVNYDFVFMAMLLWRGEGLCAEGHRCMASPFKKKSCAVNESSLVTSAHYSVILYYWKLRDSVADEGFIKGLGARLFSLLLRGGYKKARTAEPEFDRLCNENLTALRDLENEKSSSLDQCGDKFALILEAASLGAGDDDSKRALSLLFYHVGRIIYILDAVDDLGKDMEKGRFNPLIYRFNLKSPELGGEEREYINLTLEHSLGLVVSAFELLPPGIWTQVLGNIIYQGIPWVTARVMQGQWQEIGRKRNMIHD